MSYLHQLTPTHESRGCLTPQPSSRATGRNLQMNHSASIQHLGRGSLLNPGYATTRHASPYIDGKRNSSFCHPSYTSNDVFYDFDYSYKNDLPNPRLLSSVKNDKYSSGQRERLSKTPVDFRRISEEERTENMSYRSQKRPSALEIEEQVYNPWTSRDNYEYNQPSSSRSCMTPTERNRRALSHINDRPVGENFYTPRTERRPRDTPLPSIREETEFPEKKAMQKGKYCVDCVNKSHAERRKHHQMEEKARDNEFSRKLLEAEKKKGTHNREIEKMHEVIRGKEAKEARNQVILEEYRMMYGRLTGPNGGGVVLHGIYEKHDEEKKKRKAIEDELKSQNARLMEEHKVKKEFNRLDRLTSQFNSLQIKGNEYYNKYLPTKAVFTRELEEQIWKKQERLMEEKEMTRKIERQMVENDKKAVEKFNQIKQEKMEKEKKICEGQLKHWVKSKEQTRERGNIEKNKEKYYAKQAVEDHREQLRYQDLLKKSKQNLFKESLRQHQAEASYRRRHEEKKRYFEGQGNSLNIGRKVEMHPCNGCNKLKDRVLLSDM